jgi:hypothetical protein
MSSGGLEGGLRDGFTGLRGRVTPRTAPESLPGRVGEMKIKGTAPLVRLQLLIISDYCQIV